LIDIGADVVPDDLAANHHRVGGEAANPTVCPTRTMWGMKAK